MVVPGSKHERSEALLVSLVNNALGVTSTVVQQLKYFFDFTDIPGRCRAEHLVFICFNHITVVLHFITFNEICLFFYFLPKFLSFYVDISEAKLNCFKINNNRNLRYTYLV